MPTSSGHTSAICAKKVIGTDIKDAGGETIGRVEDIVLDKLSNEILFAVAGFGGFLGIGEKYHPIPWGMLDYHPDDNAYYSDLTKEQLQAAPADTIEALTAGDGMAYRESSHAYYNTPAHNALA